MGSPNHLRTFLKNKDLNENYDEQVDKIWMRLHQKLLQNPSNIKGIKNFAEILLDFSCPYPDQYRGDFWSAQISDHLVITPEYFKILLQQASEPARTNQTMLVYKEISEDLKRTYGPFGSSDTFKLVLKDVEILMKMFYQLRKDIGFVQGMTYIMVFLRFQMPPYKAFVTFSNMIVTTDLLRSFFLFDMTKMEKYVNVTTELIRRCCPEAFVKISKSEIDLSMLLVEWFFTLFTRQFEMETAARIWDKLLIKGEVFLFRLIIWIIREGFKEIEFSKLDQVNDLLR